MRPWLNGGISRRGSHQGLRWITEQKDPLYTHAAAAELLDSTHNSVHVHGDIGGLAVGAACAMELID